MLAIPNAMYSFPPDNTKRFTKYDAFLGRYTRALQGSERRMLRQYTLRVVVLPAGPQGSGRNERHKSDCGMRRRPLTLSKASLALFLLARATRAEAADAAVGARGDGVPEATTTRPLASTTTTPSPRASPTPPTPLRSLSAPPLCRHTLLR